MNPGLEIRFTLAHVDFHVHIQWPRSPGIVIRRYEVASAPFVPEIRRALLRRLKSRVRAGLKAVKSGSHCFASRPQCSRRGHAGMDGRPGVLRGL